MTGRPVSPPCPVCRHAETRAFATVESKDYWRCPVCEARFLDPAQRPSIEAERAHYDLHQNRVSDPDYQAFLRRLADPLLKKLSPGQTGLDFGCGPGPALAAMLTDAGMAMAVYDPAYAQDTTVFERKYDFITCTETAEHFHDPAGEFGRLDGLLKPDGWLGLMTTFQTDDEKFANWHYRRDPTHVVFYRRETFEVIAQHRDWACEFPADNVVLMQKCV